MPRSNPDLQMRRLLVHGLLGLLVLPSSLVLAGCSAPLQVSSTSVPQPRVITSSEIRLSGANDAWEVLERNGDLLHEFAAQESEPQQRSGLLRSIPRVIVDGVQMLEVRLLRDIPAHLISSIRIFTGGAGHQKTLVEPAESGNVVLIRTRSPEHR